MEKSLKSKKLKSDAFDEKNEDIDDSDECMGDDEEDNCDEAEDMLLDREIEVEFEALEPSASDFDGIKRLLKQLFLKGNVNVSEMANILIKNKEYTTVIKQIEDEGESEDDGEDNDDVFGVSSLIDFNDQNLENKKVVDNLRDYLVQTSKKSKNNELLNILEHNTKLGFIINERFVNLPPKLCVPVFQELVKVMHQKKCSFDYMVMIAKVLIPKKSKAKSDKSELLFLNPEEELFEEGCDFYYSVNASELCDASCRDGHWDDTDKEYSPFRHILVFKSSSWIKVVEKLKENV